MYLWEAAFLPPRIGLALIMTRWRRTRQSLCSLRARSCCSAGLASRWKGRGLACLCVRFGLKFNVDAVSRAVACTQVERHMRLCLSATAEFESLITTVGSEPLPAEAASKLFFTTLGNPVRRLANNPDLNCVDRGRRGELVTGWELSIYILEEKGLFLCKQGGQNRKCLVTC